MTVFADTVQHAPQRRYDLDWLRVCAFAILIFYHIGLFYAPGDWHVKSQYSSDLISPIMGLTNPWRLPLLFFISGVAMHLAVDRKTLAAYLPRRFTQLLVPLAFGMIVICAPQAYAELRYVGEIEPGFWRFYRDYLGFGDLWFAAPPWYHLWYIAYLLAYTLIAAALLPVLMWTANALGKPFLRWAAKGAAWRLLVAPAFPFVIYTVVLAPFFPRVNTLWGDWNHIAHTLTYFVFGFAAAKNEDFWVLVDKWLGAAVVLSLVLGGLLLAAWLHEFEVADDPFLYDAMRLTKVFYAWSMVVMLLGVARKFANRPSSVLAYLTAAVFPYYILHQTITVMVGYWFTMHDVPLAVEASVIIGATIGGCAVGYEIIRRCGPARILFGLPPANHTPGTTSRREPSLANVEVQTTGD